MLPIIAKLYSMSSDLASQCHVLFTTFVWLIFILEQKDILALLYQNVDTIILQNLFGLVHKTHVKSYVGTTRQATKCKAFGSTTNSTFWHEDDKILMFAWIIQMFRYIHQYRKTVHIKISSLIMLGVHHIG